MDMISRSHDLSAVTGLLRRHPVVGIIGARQVGKTTLAREIIQRATKPVAYFDLESPEDLARLQDPMLALKDFHYLIWRKRMSLVMSGVAASFKHF
jgi:predicted AAA+ superfamily ATPase